MLTEMGTQAITMLAIGLAAVAVAATVVVARRVAGPVGLALVAWPMAVLAGSSAVVALVVGLVARPRPLFPVGHLAYVVVTVALPAMGVVLAVVAVRRRSPWPAAAIVVALIVPAPVGWYGTHVAPFQLQSVEEHLALPAERAGVTPIRVGVLADLQATAITDFERQAVTELLALDPDVIVIPGDVFQGDDAEFEAGLSDFRSLLARLEVPGGVYATRGDTDTGDRLDRLVEGTNIEILDNEIASFEVGDRAIRVGGNPLRWAPPVAVALRDELAAGDPSDVRILVAHRPDVVLGLPDGAGIDLTVAGHTHGGQVAIPGFGPLLTFSAVPRSVAAGGLHEVNGNPIFVSTGVGMVREKAPQIRLFTRPMVAVVVLR